MLDKEEVIRTHAEIEGLIDVIGGDGSQYRRDRRVRAIVSEVCSAPRVTQMVQRRRKYGIETGVALELTTCDESSRP